MGVRGRLGTALGLLVATVMVVPALARSGEPRSLSPAQSVFHTTHPVIEASVRRLAAGSRAWREAEAAVRPTGRRVVVLTSDQVRLVSPESGRRTAFDPGVLAEVTPVVGAGARIDTVVAVLNLALLEATHWASGAPWSAFEADLDRILVHELYGHAVPYLMAGDLSGRCPDPVPGERAVDACAIQRENIVRAELGLGRRTDHGLQSLALMRLGSR